MWGINEIDVGIADLGLFKFCQLGVGPRGDDNLPDHWKAFAQLASGLVNLVMKRGRVGKAISAWLCLFHSLTEFSTPEVDIAGFVYVDSMQKKLLWEISLCWPALDTWPGVVHYPEISYDNHVAQRFYAPVP